MCWSQGGEQVPGILLGSPGAAEGPISRNQTFRQSPSTSYSSLRMGWSRSANRSSPKVVPLLNAPHALEHCIPECEVKGSPIVGLHPSAELGEVVPELIDDGGMVHQVETILGS